MKRVLMILSMMSLATMHGMEEEKENTPPGFQDILVFIEHNSFNFQSGNFDFLNSHILSKYSENKQVEGYDKFIGSLLSEDKKATSNKLKAYYFRQEVLEEFFKMDRGSLKNSDWVLCQGYATSNQRMLRKRIKFLKLERKRNDLSNECLQNRMSEFLWVQKEKGRYKKMLDAIKEENTPITAEDIKKLLSNEKQ